MGGVMASLALVAPGIASATSGGGLTAAPEVSEVPTESSTSSCAPESGGMANSTHACDAFQKARLIDEVAVPAPDAPLAVKKVIAAADAIRTTPYIWGGGHANWLSRGYDCSGAVSFALHGGNFLKSPLVSGEMTHWGAPGKGRWITVYANSVHAFAVIDGLRWDTVGDPRGVSGPRWHPSMAGDTTRGFIARHPVGY